MYNNLLENKNKLAATNTKQYIIRNENVAADLTMLYEISGNDKDFIDKMVFTFLKNMPETIKMLEHFVKSKNWDEVYKHAHAARSSLSVIKIAHIFEWVSQVEEDARSKTNLDKIPDLVKRIKEKFSFAERILKEKFERKNETFY